MRREIAGPIQRRFLRIADRDRTDGRFADFRLKRYFQTMCLEPHIELLEPAPGLHANDVPPCIVKFEPYDFIKLTRA